MRSTIKWRKAYDGLEEEASAAAAIDFSDATSLTVQSAKDDADINVLVRRFGVTGSMPRPNMQPFYGDFSGVTDYQTALNQVMEADAAFEQLPAELRSRFHNDPGELWAYLHDPELDKDEARKLGLLEPEKPAPAPQKVEVVNPTPPVSGAPSGAPGASKAPPDAGAAGT